MVSFAHNATAQLYPDRYDADSYVPRSAVTPAETKTSEPTPADHTPSTDQSTTDASGPGFTAVGALVALLALVCTQQFRRRRP
nr:hypothetical protein [Haloarcula sp. CBA1122]